MKKAAAAVGSWCMLSGVGTPTATYPAGEEEVCFVPTTVIESGADRKVKITSFTVAVRRQGAAGWKYIDGAPLARKPEMLYRLLPQLERGIALPQNTVEVLP